ncbi:ATP-dependent DNA helicase RecQ [Ancylomarina sp. 16SWW S1-10-2]|uniref:RecQ family ATP-dependent DNA helicase n=1 Tax=Ancylomarina sp. 16SWW S1-10-2 TaxID=2499681 RepID=UPI0012AE99C4|nr:ATP-dependent DNA helicase RecQ [Ancylomarina sp. 16SWW S1-10-2]MRT93161.1 RecQ family ATP-dependent DNA helicase [Ancylomarina sp. 16SWW S1-10-2]
MSIYHKILKKYWGYDEFRSLQEDIILSVAEGRDTLGLMPTGGGKSLTFQVPTMAMEGLCIVVSPLVALMKDQVLNLKEKGIKAELIYSGLTRDEIEVVLNKCLYGKNKFLYISPERISTAIFQEKLLNMKVCLIAIDESHCISQWGYDFRPSYLKIVQLRELLPGIPVLALTATATPEVVDDIQDRLGFEKKNVFRKSFERSNLSYLVRNIEDKNRYLLKILRKQKGSSVVYVRSRKKCKEIAEFLKLSQIKAEYYHAGLDNAVKDMRQQRWRDGIVQVMVATNAFGMGIDKSDVRTVVHLDLPDTLEAYFQEAGRAGRDGERAYAVLLYSNPDKVQLLKRIKTSYPELETVKRVYQAVGNFLQIAEGAGKDAVFDFNLALFCQKFKFNVLHAFNSLKILQRAGYLEITDDLEHSTKLHFVVNRDDLYRYQIENKQQDEFIKLLLRTYTGLFTDYVPVNLESLAYRKKVNIKVLIDNLKDLSHYGIIKYIPRKKTPFIIYTQERLPLKYLRFPKEVYQERKERFIDKINAVIQYAESTDVCRSKMLLEYFGQLNASNCGECDICKEKNKSIGSKLYENIQSEVKAILAKEESSVFELVELSQFPEKKLLEVIRVMMDNDEVKTSENNKIRLA